MCCCHKNISEKVTKFVIESSNSNDFFDINLGDVANIFIATITVGLGIYVFVYQRKKDRKDQEIILSQIKSATKLEMFKLLIIEPNVNNLHTFFTNLNSSFQTLKGARINSVLINQAQTDLDTHCNDFEESFIKLLDGIDHQFYLSVIATMDVLRDGVSVQISNLPINSLGDISNIEDLFFEFKTNFIKSLYNFNSIEN